MNDLLHDIRKLKEIQEAVGQFSSETIKSLLQDLIDAKQKEFNKFEEEAMSRFKDLLIEREIKFWNLANDQLLTANNYKEFEENMKSIFVKEPLEKEWPETQELVRHYWIDAQKILN